ncbi:MAG: abhydrolase domain-containing 18 [Deltaproteobacteria bacterium]|nr:MAG: abhydrolase domain-containing 18 [Deltaproteobacteria bacterium]
MMQAASSGSDPSLHWLTRFAAGVDSLALAAARTLIDWTIMPQPHELDLLRDSAKFYLQPEFQTQPRRFFSFLDQTLTVPEVSLTPKRSRTSGPDRYLLEFKSAYEPADPDHRTEHARQIENHTVRAELWLHRNDRARGTLIALHGFGMGNPLFDAPALMASNLFRLGLDVALFTLPLHGQRKPQDSRFSGQLFASPRVSHLNEAIGQAVHDLALLIRWLRSRSDRPVGLLGLSLGGYVAALMASLVDDLDFVVPMAAPVCFGDMAFRFISKSRHYRRKPEAVPQAEELLDAYRIHSPLTHPLSVPRERVMIVAGRGDRVVPSEHAARLWHHWGRPRIHWYGGSHIAPFGRRRVLKAISGFLSELGVT